MQRSPRLLCLSGCLIALLTGGLAPSFAQQTTQADAQATLQTALKKLDSIAPQLDPETRKSVPATRMII